MIRFVSAILLVIVAASAHAQYVSIGTIDSSRFPEMRAEIYLLDAQGERIDGITASDLTLSENGVERSISSLRCPSDPRPRPVSSVLTIDISGSMAYSSSGPNGLRNMELAKEAARAWIDAQPDDGESRTAVTSFDDRGQIVVDFTRDRNRLLAAIDQLEPARGTNYHAALIDPPSGGILVAQGGVAHRVVVFLTDGKSGANEERIVAAAKKGDVTLFVVTVGMAAPDVLKNVARRTGGEYFENVTTVEQARGIYQAILYRAAGGEPCEIAWRSEPGCTVDRTVNIALPSRSMSGVALYTMPDRFVPRLEATPGTVAFGRSRADDARDTLIRITARNRPVTIERIERIGSGSEYELETGALPTTLAPGESRDLRLRFRPNDTTYHFARWRIVSDACESPFLYATGGVGGRPAPTIRVVHPNGGERFVAGERTTIRWEGVLPTDIVRLDYSTDAGATWTTVSPRSTGLAQEWMVPPTPSERCLMRVAQLDPTIMQARRSAELAGHTDWIFDADFSPDGSRVVTADFSGTARLFDARSGSLLRSLPIGSRTAPHSLYFASFSPDGRRIVTATQTSVLGGMEVQVWDAASGRRTATFPGYVPNHPAPLTGISAQYGRDPALPTGASPFSPDGRSLLVFDDSVAVVRDLASGRETRRLGHPLRVRSAQFTPDGRAIVTASDDNSARIWRSADGAQLQILRHETPVRLAVVSPDGALVATSSHDDTIRVWNAATGELLRKIGGLWRGRSDPPPYTIRFAPDGSGLLVWHESWMKPTLFDPLSGTPLRKYTGYAEPVRLGDSSIGAIVYSADGSRLAITSDIVEDRVTVLDAATGEVINRYEMDAQLPWTKMSPDGATLATITGGTLSLWPIEQAPIQIDGSDNLWTILEAKSEIPPVDFGDVAVGGARDTIVTAYIRNTGSVSLEVASLTIDGPHAREFRVLSGSPPLHITPGSSHAVELGFSPTRSGNREATAVVVAGGRRLEAPLTGRGVPPRLELLTELIDFDTVVVGEERDSLVSVMLRNVGTVPVEITDAAIVGPDRESFSIVEGGGAFALGAGESRRMLLRFAPDSAGRTSSRIRFRHNAGPQVVETDLYGVGVLPEGEEYRDPTTFRTIASPNAIIPKRGTIVAGSYDLVGLMAGYVVTDGVMVLAGGAVPLPDDWGGINGQMYGAASIGFKAGMELIGRLNVAVGYQYGWSVSDREETEKVESTIRLHAPYLALSYGDDDSRVSIAAGYAFKRHAAIGDFGGIAEFDRDAAIVSIGGDYRFASRWKIAAEVVSMKTLGYIPIALTARYFGHTWAIDAGGAFLGIGDGPEIPVAPVVSFVKIF